MRSMQGSLVHCLGQHCGLMEYLIYMHVKSKNKVILLIDSVPKSFIYRPGPGHIELNMACLLLEYLWLPVIKDVAKSLGFGTSRALDLVRRGWTTNKAIRFDYCV